MVITKCSQSLENTNLFETHFSDFHKLTSTVLKHYFPKQNHKVVSIDNIKILVTICFNMNLIMHYLHLNSITYAKV